MYNVYVWSLVCARFFPIISFHWVSLAEKILLILYWKNTIFFIGICILFISSYLIHFQIKEFQSVKITIPKLSNLGVRSIKIYFFPRKKINSQSITNGLLPKISFFLCWTKLNGTNKIITTRWLVACYCKWWPFILSSVTISHHQSILITCMICLSHNSIAHIIVANVTSRHASIFILSLFSNLQNIEFTLCLICVFSGYPLACYPIWYCWKLFEFVQNACLFFYSNPGANLN